MAHTPGAPARIQRLSSLVAILAVALAIALAFGRILQGPSAAWRLLAVGVASGLIAWATERRGMLFATLCSAAGLLLALTWLAAPQTTWFQLPTAETLRTLGSLATQVGGQARDYVSPAPATPALILAGTIAVWAAVFSCYALAFRAQSPLLALIPPLALIVFADSVIEEVIRPIFGVWFLLAALAVLFADSLRRIRGWGPVWSPTANRDRLFPTAGRNARRVGLTALMVAALAPVFMPGFGTKPVFDLSSINSDGRIRVSPLVSMGSVLSQAQQDGGNVEVFQVQSDHPSYWRMVALDSFDGDTWQPAPDAGVVIASDSQVPDIAGYGAESTQSTQTFTISSDLGYPWLAVPPDPLTVQVDHKITWHAASSSLELDQYPDAGESYSVTSFTPSPTADTLRAVGTAEEGAIDLTLPPIPSSVGEKARLWTGGLDNDYDKVMAIWQHLAHGDFEYKVDVPYGDDAQALADFLVKKQGFCQQFASLMAVMLRELDIPARVAFGYNQGTPLGDGVYSIRTRNLHSWVEVPFQGYGWLGFDPTPGFSDPSATWMPKVTEDPPVCPGPLQGCTDPGKIPGTRQLTRLHNPIKGSTLNEEFGNVAGDVSGTAPAGPAPRQPVGIVLAAGAAIALGAAIGIPLLHRARRRRRLHAARDPRTLILATYDVFGERAGELGWSRSPGETPEEFRRRLSSAAVLADIDDPRLGRLTSTVVRAAYAPTQPDERAATEAADDADAVLHELREAAPLRQRLLGLYRRT
jgi:transglutaminase-like putative cysteine protease